MYYIDKNGEVGSFVVKDQDFQFKLALLNRNPQKINQILK